MLAVLPCYQYDTYPLWSRSRVYGPQIKMPYAPEQQPSLPSGVRSFSEPHTDPNIGQGLPCSFSVVQLLPLQQGPSPLSAFFLSQHSFSLGPCLPSYIFLQSVRWKFPLNPFYYFPGGSVAKNLPANAGDTGDVGSIPGSGRSPEGRNGNPLQYSCQDNPMDRGTWQTAIHGVAKSQI